MCPAPRHGVSGDASTVAAGRIVAATGARTVLHLGNADAPLVHALRDHGVAVRTGDLPASGPDSPRAPGADRRVGSLFGGEAVDLVTCIGIVGQLDPVGAQMVVDEICGATDRVLFSALPRDPGTTRITTLSDGQAVVQWSAWFAERGFLRRTDLDLTAVGRSAALFQRDERATMRDVVERYESRLVPLLVDDPGPTPGSPWPGRDRRHVEAADRSLLERHAALVARENVIGLEAQVARLQADLQKSRANVRRLRERVRLADEELTAVRGSRSWRIGRALTAPLRKLRP